MTDESIGSFTCEWDSAEKRCIITRFDPPLTWLLIQTAHEEIYRRMRSVDHRVDWINDISCTPDVPRDHLLANLRYLHQRVPPNAGMNVVVGSTLSRFTRSVLSIFANAVNWQYGFGFADTVEEALEMVHHARAAHTNG
jgi:hypothetical protein